MYFNFLKSKYWSVGIISGLALLFILSLWNRFADGDEGVIAEWVYWFLQDGNARSVLYEPFGLGFETKLYVYHKLFVWASSIIVAIFGMSLLPLKLFSFAMAIVSVFIFKKYALLFNDKSKPLFLLSLLIFALNARIFQFALTFRPEIMVSALGLLSFYLLFKYNSSNKKTYVLLAGITAALALLTHLNGISYCIAGFFLLVWQKSFKHIIYYVVGGVGVSLLYFADNISPDAINSFIVGLSLAPDVTSDQFTLISPLIKLLTEHQRFFHSPVEISITILLLLTLLFSNKKFRLNNKSLLRYTLLLIIFLGATTHGKNPKYFILYVPFLSLIIAQFLMQIDAITKIKRTIFLFFLASYFVIQGVYIGILFSNSYNLSALNNILYKIIPENSNVITHSNFVFGGMGKYRIHSASTFNFMHGPNNWNCDLKTYLDFCKRNNNDFVVLTKEYTNKCIINSLEFSSNMQGKQISNDYLVYHATNEFLILKKNQKKIVSALKK